MKHATDAEIKESNEKVQAIFFILHADKARFGPRIRELERAMYEGRDVWPVTVVNAYHLLIKTQEQLISVEARLSRTNRGGRGSGRGGAQLIQQDGRGGVRASSGGRGRGNGQYQPPPVSEGVTLVPGVDGTTVDLQCYGFQS
jgi:hypothetical protein